ncbi:MAG: helix-turn-helix domain-containing protein [Lactobacillaceae bacterium]|jgi:hypothetical protein|nr:helix-turn-helix domain-containing protein [Lactobacillaceae bacterium]
MWVGNFDWMLNDTDLKAVELNNYLIFDTTTTSISFVQIKRHFNWSPYIVTRTVKQLEQLGHDLLSSDHLAFNVQWNDRVIHVNRETIVNPGLLKNIIITRSDMAKYLYAIATQTYPGNVKFRLQQNLSENELAILVKKVRNELQCYDISISHNLQLTGNEINIRLLIFDFLWRMNSLLNVNKIGDGYVNKMIFESFENFDGFGGTNQKEMLLNAISTWILRLQNHHFIDLEDVELYRLDFNFINIRSRKHLYELKHMIKEFFPQMSEDETTQEVQYMWVSLIMLVSNETNADLLEGTVMYQKIVHFQTMAMDTFKDVFDIELDQNVRSRFFSITYGSIMNFLLYSPLHSSNKRRPLGDNKVKYPIVSEFMMIILDKMAKEMEISVKQVELYLLDDYIGAFLAVIDPKILPKVNVGIFFPENSGNDYILKDQISARFVGFVNVHTEVMSTDDVIITSRPLNGLDKMTTLIFDSLPNENQINYIYEVIQSHILAKIRK